MSAKQIAFIGVLSFYLFLRANDSMYFKHTQYHHSCTCTKITVLYFRQTCGLSIKDIGDARIKVKKTI